MIYSIGYDDVNYKWEIRLLLWFKFRDWDKFNSFNLVLLYLIYVKVLCWFGIWKCVFR